MLSGGQPNLRITSTYLLYLSRQLSDSDIADPKLLVRLVVIVTASSVTLQPNEPAIKLGILMNG